MRTYYVIMTLCRNSRDIARDSFSLVVTHGDVTRLDGLLLHRQKDVHNGVERPFGYREHALGIADVGKCLRLAANPRLELLRDRVAGGIILGAVELATGCQSKLAHADILVRLLQRSVGLKRLHVRADACKISK